MIGIEVKNLTKKLGPNVALDNLTLSFAPGLLHGVIGPDGAGKTTLIRTLMGLLKPNNGDVAYSNDGRPVSFSDVRPKMAYMPQQQSLYADLSIAEHLNFFRDMYRIPSSVFIPRRNELLAITRLDKFVDRPAGKLSGGMYKKLGLMCALLQSPDVLLLDEPTNGVDPISRREFWDLLYRLRDQQILIIISTAYMDEAERCSVVHVMDRGKRLAEGEPQQVLQTEHAESFDDLFLKKSGVPHG